LLIRIQASHRFSSAAGINVCVRRFQSLPATLSGCGASLRRGIDI
jgi:hypothetical protein